MKIKLTREYEYWRANNESYICIDELDKWVDIPKKVKNIWVTLSTKPEKGWIKLKLGIWALPYLETLDGDYENICLKQYTRAMVNSMNSKIVYILFEY